MIIAKHISSLITHGIRIIKVVCFGKSDVRTASECSPFGIDGNATANMQAIYSDTVSNGQPVILGYINLNQVAGIGESRMYSTDADGALKTYIWLHADGTMEIGGNANHMTQFEGLKTAYDQLKADHDTFIDKWNAFASDYVPGSPSTTGLPASLAGSILPHSTGNITGAKLTNIKTE